MTDETRRAASDAARVYWEVYDKRMAVAKAYLRKALDAEIVDAAKKAGAAAVGDAG